MVIESYLCRTGGGPGITLSTPLILYMTVLLTSGLPCLGQRSTLNADVLGQCALYFVVLPVTQHLTCFIIPTRSSLPFLCIWDTIILLLCSLPVSDYSLVAGPLFFACPLMYISVPEHFLTHAVTVLARMCWTTQFSIYSLFSKPRPFLSDRPLLLLNSSNWDRLFLASCISFW